MKKMTIEDWTEIDELAEEYALSLIPDSICPVCDSLEMTEPEGCPGCGYSMI